MIYPKIPLAQSVIENVQTLNDELVDGQTTLDKFQQLVEQGNEEFAGQYGANYVSNYVKLQLAIDKFKHLLQS